MRKSDKHSIIFFLFFLPWSIFSAQTNAADHHHSCQTDTTAKTQSSSVVKKQSNLLLRPVKKVKSVPNSEGHRRQEVSYVTEQTATALYAPTPHFVADSLSVFGGGEVEVSNILNSEELHVLVLDLYGRTILYRRFEPGHDVINYKVGLNSRNMENGIYSLQIIKGSKVHVQKFVISNTL